MFSEHIERTVLGAMLLEPLAAQDGIAGLSASDFHLDAHQRLFRAIAKASEHGSCDIITVADVLDKNRELDAVGGRDYLYHVTEGIPKHFSIDSYVRRLRDESLGRRAISVFQEASARLMERNGSVLEIVDGVTRSLADERPDETLTAAQVIPSALERLHSGKLTIIPTGIREIDEMTYGGIRTKELWIIGAQPSGGKSALCRQMERSAIRAGYGVHAHSIEIDREKWMLQHAAYVGGVEAWKLRQPELLNVVDRDKMLGAGAKVAEWDYRIDDAGGVTIDALLAKSRISAMRHGTKVFTVDYLQRLVTKSKSRKEDLSEAVVRLKEFAKEYDVAVIALSQLARTGDINARPTVQSLKESGDLEAAADVVVLNYRPKNLEQGHYTGEDELILGKQRDGAVGGIPMHFNTESLTFESRRA